MPPFPHPSQLSDLNLHVLHPTTFAADSVPIGDRASVGKTPVTVFFPFFVFFDNEHNEQGHRPGGRMLYSHIIHLKKQILGRHGAAWRVLFGMMHARRQHSRRSLRNTVEPT